MPTTRSAGSTRPIRTPPRTRTSACGHAAPATASRTAPRRSRRIRRSAIWRRCCGGRSFTATARPRRTGASAPVTSPGGGRCRSFAAMPHCARSAIRARISRPSSTPRYCGWRAWPTARASPARSGQRRGVPAEPARAHGSPPPVVRRWVATTLEGRLLLAILAAAFLLRIGVVAFSRHFKPVADPADYDRIALSLAGGHGFGATALAQPGSPSALRPPLYPLLLGATYRIAGHSWTAARTLEALLGVVFVLLVFLLAGRLYGRRVALVAGALAAVMPTLVVLNASLLSETLFLPLEIAAVLAGVAWRQRPSPWVAVAGGLACGAAILTRSVGIALLVAIIAMIVTARVALRIRLRAAALVAGTAVVLVLPWAVRNAVELHAFVPVSTQDGPTAAGVYNRVTFSDQRFYAVWHPPFFLREFQPLFFDGIDEAELDSRLRRSALHYATAHPGDVAAAVGLNTLRLFFDAGRGHVAVRHLWYDEEGVPRWLQPPLGWVVRLLTLVVLLTLLAAACRRFSIGHWYVWVAPLLLYAAVIPFHGGNRYAAPITPFLILAAGIGIASLVESGRSSGDVAPPQVAQRLA